MRKQYRNYILAGVPFVIIGLIANPWLISWLFEIDFTTTIFSGILIISLIFIVIGWGIIYKKEMFYKWIINKYRDLALILLNFILILGILNFIAAIMLFKGDKKAKAVDYFYSPSDLFIDSISFMRNIYPDKTDEIINGLVMFKSPYANHPVLEYQERIQESENYNVGIEGIRFDHKVTPETAPYLINGSVWVFGGSTTFGQGVKDDETITAYLNRIDSSQTYINFGVHAFHQSNEISKMLLLLNKGYLPSKIIFIDGLNDIIRMIETNFHPLETPSLAKSAYSSDYNIATKETGNTILKQMPVSRLLRSYVGEEKGPDEKLELPWTKHDNVYDAENIYNTNARQHFQSTLLRSPYKQIDTSGLNYVTWKLEEMYKHNYDFVLQISEAFDFDFTIYYQPFGVLSENNPFWKDAATSKTTPLYTNFKYVISKVRRSLSVWELDNFIDISDAHESCATCYVDLTHYNYKLNRIIAQEIYEKEKMKEGNEEVNIKANPDIKKIVSDNFITIK
jgi:hypothetical protein